MLTHHIAILSNASSSTTPGTAASSGVEITNLSKIFPPANRFHSSESVTALDDVTLQMQKGQIFGLLGHNGAGKSTLMSILCGMAYPTSGHATIFGLDCGKDVDRIRPQMGVCLQKDILFNGLSVYEHLVVVAGLKGMSFKDAKAEADRLVEAVDLADQKDVLSKGLSGGQKRKLCVGMALVGSPKILFLEYVDRRLLGFLWFFMVFYGF